MVRESLPRRLLAALAGSVLVVLLGASYSFAADPSASPPVSPDPVPSVSVSPSASVAPDPLPSASPSVSASSPAVVDLGSDQFDALLWLGGALLATSIVGVVGSWSR